MMVVKEQMREDGAGKRTARKQNDAFRNALPPSFRSHPSQLGRGAGAPRTTASLSR